MFIYMYPTLPEITNELMGELGDIFGEMAEKIAYGIDDFKPEVKRAIQEWLENAYILQQRKPCPFCGNTQIDQDDETFERPTVFCANEDCCGSIPGDTMFQACRKWDTGC